MKVATENYGNVDFSYEPIDIIKEKPQFENNYRPNEEIIENEEEKQTDQSHALTVDETVEHKNSSANQSNSVVSKPNQSTSTQPSHVENKQEQQPNTSLPEPKPSEGQ